MTGNNPPMTENAPPTLPQRRQDLHKASAGVVAVIGGCAHPASRMLGAPALAARAALRAGAGLVRIAAPEPIASHILTIEPHATALAIPTDDQHNIIPHLASQAFDTLAEKSHCIAIGPGLGATHPQSTNHHCAVEALTLHAIQQDTIPVVIDADAINALARVREPLLDFRAPAVLTPHPGEFKRLAASLGQNNHTTDQALNTDDTRTAACQQLAARLGCIIILTGKNTVVSDGLRTWTNNKDHPCLATAGTGDILTGLLAALIAQHVAPPPPAPMPAGFTWPKPPEKPLDLYDAARIAVQTHGEAAQTWAKKKNASAGLLAAELADLLPNIIEQQRA